MAAAYCRGGSGTGRKGNMFRGYCATLGGQTSQRLIALSRFPAQQHTERDVRRGAVCPSINHRCKLHLLLNAKTRSLPVRIPLIHPASHDLGVNALLSLKEHHFPSVRNTKTPRRVEEIKPVFFFLCVVFQSC